MPRSARFQLLQVRLGRDLSQYVTDRYPSSSWRTIANDLTQITGVSISHETLRTWFPELSDHQAAVGAA
jgi:hypothetical protein